jgi:GDP-L-fucose synthase
MKLSDKIYVAGHSGLAGAALVRRLRAAEFSNIVTRTHAELDLTDGTAVRRFFSAERPDHVFLAAARVGGIVANNTYPADFISQNLAIQNNVMIEAWRHRVQRLIFLGSSCIYPRDCPQPIRESYLLTGPLEHTNRAYAIAKIAGVEACWAFNRQYQTRFIAAMPTNLYGPGDHYNLKDSHVLPALIRKMHEAWVRGDRQVTVWGTGAPRRELLYSDDMADACVFLAGLPENNIDELFERGAQAPLINIGYGSDMSIRELAGCVAALVGYTGEPVFDSSFPDGTPQKLLDSSRIRALGWAPATRLDDGIRLTYADFLARHGGNPAGARDG